MVAFKCYTNASKEELVEKLGDIDKVCDPLKTECWGQIIIQNKSPTHDRKDAIGGQLGTVCATCV